MAASLLAIVAGIGLKASIKHPWYRASGVRGLAALLILVAFWLSRSFSAQLFGIEMSGKVWVAIGLFTSAIFTATEGARRLWMLQRFQRP
jgi:hypothetical protein